jgi:hypothetical protein
MTIRQRLLFVPLIVAALASWAVAPLAAQTITGVSGTIATNGDIVTATVGLQAHPPDGFGMAAIGLYGTFTGTFQFEGSVNCSNYEALRAVPIGTTTVVTSATATGTWRASVSGLQCIRVRASAAVTGSVSVYIRGAEAAGDIASGVDVGTVTNVATIGTSVTPGTAAANLGKAEDAVANSGDTGVFMLGVIDATNATQRAATGDYAQVTVDHYGTLLARSDHPNRFSCIVPVSVATTLTAIGGSCAAPGAGLSLYITDIEFGSSAASGTAADSFPTLKSGTGGTCGTATAVIWQALTAANTTQVANYTIPLKVTANNEVCWIMSTAGSKTLQVRGFIAP